MVEEFGGIHKGDCNAAGAIHPDEFGPELDSVPFPLRR
jgi:hypothetical protein